jgi:hypothetical protein
MIVLEILGVMFSRVQLLVLVLVHSTRETAGVLQARSRRVRNCSQKVRVLTVVPLGLSVPELPFQSLEIQAI